MHTCPPEPNMTTTTFTTDCPATSVRFDASGRGAPHGNTVTYPDPTGFVTVTFTATAAASPRISPTPPPGQASSALFPYTTLFRSVRVSRMRVGLGMGV